MVFDWEKIVTKVGEGGVPQGCWLNGFKTFVSSKRVVQAKWTS